MSENYTNRKLVYVASPFTKGNTAKNVRNSLFIATQLWNRGFLVYAPLLTHFWNFLTPMPYGDWMDMSLEFVKRCDVLLRLPGESRGADMEVMLAETLKIPVYYSVRELLCQNKT